MKKFLSGCLKVFGVLFVLLLVIGFVGGGSGSKSKGSANKDQEATAEQTGEGSGKEEENEATEQITYQDVDINTLFETLESNPLNAKNTYDGATIRFSGVLTNIDSSGKYFNLGNGDEWSFKSIQCYIRDDATLDKIASANMGDTITVCGKITSVGEVLGYSLDVDYIE